MNGDLNLFTVGDFIYTLFTNKFRPKNLRVYFKTWLKVGIPATWVNPFREDD